MKRIIIFLFLLFNLLPVMEKGKLTLSGPLCCMAQSNGEESDSDWSNYWANQITDYGSDLYSNGNAVAYNNDSPSVSTTLNTDGSTTSTISIPSWYIAAGGVSILDSFDPISLGVSIVCSPVYNNGIMLPEVTITATAPTASDFIHFCDVIDLGVEQLDEARRLQYEANPNTTQSPPPNPPVPIIHVDPCGTASKQAAEKISNLNKNTNVSNSIVELKNNMNNITDHEQYCYIGTSGSTIEIETGASSNDSPQLVPYWVDGFTTEMHTHPASNRAQSAGDLLSLAQLKQGISTTQGVEVITQNGTQYYVGIVDANLLDKFTNELSASINTTTHDFDQNSDIGIEMGAVIISFRSNNLSPDDAYSAALAYILQAHNTGLVLYKKDTDGNFKAITSSSTYHPTGEPYTYSTSNCQ